MVRYLLLDIDGVLTEPSESYSPELKKELALLMSRGIQIHLVTSRPYAFSKPVIDWYALNEASHIFESGNLIINKSVVIQEASISRLIFDNIIQALHVDPNTISLQVSTASKCFLSQPCLKRLSHLAKLASPLNDFSKSNSFLTLGFRGLLDQQKKVIESSVTQDLMIETHLRDSGTWTIFIRKARNSKLTALKKIESLGIINLKDSMFITDDSLDTAVFPYLAKAAVPKNASIKAKKKANYISDFSYTAGCLDLIRSR